MKLDKSIIIGMVIVLLVSPIVAALSISNVKHTEGDDYADINWTTDTAADSKVYYGTTTGLGLSQFVYGNVLEHGARLSGLLPATTYYYAVESYDGSTTVLDNNNGQMFSLTTKISLTITEVNVAETGMDFARINWTTNLDSSTQVKFGETSSNLDKVATGIGGVQEHSVILSGLDKGKEYYYKVISDYKESAVQSFRTKSDTAISDFKNVTIPEIYNKDRLDVGGVTDPNAEVYLYVEGILKRQWTADSEGRFNFKDVLLTAELNNLKLRAEDYSGNSVEKTYIVKLDKEVPKVAIAEIPDKLLESSMQLSGKVNEQCTAKFYINNELIKTADITGNFSETMRLKEGANSIRIEFTDLAGNVFSYRKSVNSDTQAPTIVLMKKLSDFSPSYSRSIKVSGNVSEPATIYIDILGKDNLVAKTYTVEADGPFEKAITLETLFEVTTTTSQTTIETPRSYENRIRIYATDKAGRNSTFITDVVTYQAICGQGGHWGVNIGVPQPASIIPAHLEKGFGMIAFDVELTWQGPGDVSNVQIVGTPTVRAYQISPSMREKYNEELIGNIPAAYFPSNKRKGYVTIPLLKPTQKIEGFEKLIFPLEIDVQYTYKDYNNAQQGGRQRQCFDISVLVDKEIDERHLPEKFVKNAINFFNKTSEAIDKMLEPLQKVDKVLFWTCKAMQLRNMFERANEIKACYPLKSGKGWKKEFNDFLASKTGGVTVDDCDNWAFTSSKDKSNCRACLDAVKASREAGQQMQYICDREICPSVPTVHKYAADQTTKKGKEIFYAPKSGLNDMNRFSSVSFCQLSEIPKTEADMKEKLQVKNSKEALCKAEYDFVWQPAALLVNNEYERSIKLDELSRTKKTDDPYDIAYGGFFNTINSICGKKQTAVKDLRITNTVGKEQFQFKRKDGEWYWVVESASYDLKTPSNVKVDIQNKGGLSTYKNDKYKEVFDKDGRKYTEYSAPLTYYNNFLYIKQSKPANAESIQGKTTPSGPAIELFRDPANTNTAVNAEGVPFTFSTSGSTAGYWVPDSKKTIQSEKGPISIGRIAEEVRASQQTRAYVFKPTSDFFTSIQGVCVSGMVEYLKQWKKISDAVKGCFQNLLVNKKFSGGICEATLSRHVCDMVFNLIRCTFKYAANSGKPQTRPQEGGVINFFQALTSAGGSVQSDVRERYGATSTFQAMFNDKKIVNSFCLGAISGDWDLRFDEIFQESRARAVTVEPQVALAPTSRRFITVNPLTGYATYIYHIGLGIVSGNTDATCRISMICSDTNDCDAAHFTSGQCDCAYGQGRRTYALPNRIVRAGEISFGPESDMYTQIADGKYRYDRVEVVCEYRDNKNQIQKVTKNMRLSEEGAGAPAECKFDLISKDFRCLIKFGQYGYAAFLGDIKPVKSPVYVGDNLRIQGNVEKRSPVDKANYPMYVRTKVFDSTGAQISVDKNYLMDKDARYNLEEMNKDGIPGVTVDNTMFTTGAGVQLGRVASNQQVSDILDTYSNMVLGDLQRAEVKVKFTGTDDNIRYQVTSSGTCTVCGVSYPVNTDEISFKINAATIRIRNARKAKNGEELTITPPSSAVGNRLRVRISLHATYESGDINPEEIDFREIDFTINSGTSRDICSGGGINPQTYPCDCNENGRLGDVEDCDGQTKKYCITTKDKGNVCKEFPLCQQGKLLTVACDCDRNAEIGDSKKYCDGTDKKYCYADVCYDSLQSFAPKVRQVTFVTDKATIAYKFDETPALKTYDRVPLGTNLILNVLFIDETTETAQVVITDNAGNKVFDKTLPVEDNSVNPSFLTSATDMRYTVVVVPLKGAIKGDEIRFTVEAGTPLGITQPTTAREWAWVDSSFDKIGLTWSPPVPGDKMVKRSDGSPKWDPFNFYKNDPRYSASMYNSRWKSVHRGMDIYAPESTDVLAVADGEVIRVSAQNNVYVLHRGKSDKDGSQKAYTSCYLHLKNPAVKVGDKVTRGQKVAEVYYPGVHHLHFEMYSKRVDSAAPSSKLGKNNENLGKFGCRDLDNTDPYLINPIDLIGNYGTTSKQPPGESPEEKTEPIPTGPDKITEVAVYSGSGYYATYDPDVYVKTQNGLTWKIGEYGWSSGVYEAEGSLESDALAHIQKNSPELLKLMQGTIRNIKGVPNFWDYIKQKGKTWDSNDYVYLNEFITETELFKVVPGAPDKIKAVIVKDETGDDGIHMTTEQGKSFRLGAYDDTNGAYSKDNYYYIYPYQEQEALEYFKNNAEQLNLFKATLVNIQEYPNFISYRIANQQKWENEKQLDVSFLINLNRLFPPTIGAKQPRSLTQHSDPYIEAVWVKDTTGDNAIFLKAKNGPTWQLGEYTNYYGTFDGNWPATNQETEARAWFKTKGSDAEMSFDLTYKKIEAYKDIEVRIKQFPDDWNDLQLVYVNELITSKPASYVDAGNPYIREIEVRDTWGNNEITLVAKDGTKFALGKYEAVWGSWMASGSEAGSAEAYFKAKGEDARKTWEGTYNNVMAANGNDEIKKQQSDWDNYEVIYLNHLIAKSTTQPTTPTAIEDPIVDLYAVDGWTENPIYLVTKSNKKFRLGYFKTIGGTYTDAPVNEYVAYVNTLTDKYKKSYETTLDRVKRTDVGVLSTVLHPTENVKVWDLKHLIMPAEGDAIAPPVFSPIITIYVVQAKETQEEIYHNVFIETRDLNTNNRLKIGQVRRGLNEFIPISNLDGVSDVFKRQGPEALLHFENTLKNLQGIKINPDKFTKFTQTSVIHWIPAWSTFYQEYRIFLDSKVDGNLYRVKTGIDITKRLGDVYPSKNAEAKALVESLHKWWIIDDSAYNDIIGRIYVDEDHLGYLRTKYLEPLQRHLEDDVQNIQ